MSFGAGQPEYRILSHDVQAHVAQGLETPDMLPEGRGQRNIMAKMCAIKNKDSGLKCEHSHPR